MTRINIYAVMAWIQSILLAGILGYLAGGGSHRSSPDPIEPTNPIPVNPKPPGPPGPMPTAFFRIGQGYRGELAAAYAKAWESGISKIIPGKNLDEAFTEVGKAFEAERSFLYAKNITPELEKIAPGRANDQATVDALKAALQDFLRGLRSPTSGN